MALPNKENSIRYDDYLSWNEGTRCEVLNGEIISMSPSPTPKHQDILGGIYAEFRTYLKGKTCKVFISPIDVCLFANQDSSEQDIQDWLQPDLLVVCDPKKIGDKRIVGCPDFVIEVLSPSTTKNDRVLKYNAYAKAGVKEYWIVDPYHEFIEVFLLKGNSFENSGQYFKSDMISLHLFGDFSLHLSEIFATES